MAIPLVNHKLLQFHVPRPWHHQWLSVDTLFAQVKGLFIPGIHIC